MQKQQKSWKGIMFNTNIIFICLIKAIPWFRFVGNVGLKWTPRTKLTSTCGFFVFKFQF